MRLRAPVSPLDAPREVDLLGLCEEGGLADLVQVHLDCVPGVAALEVSLEDLFDELGVLLFGQGLGKKLSVDYLDAVFAQEAVDLLDLVGREVDLLEEVQNLAGLEGAGLLAGLEEFLYLFYVPQVTLGLQALPSGSSELKLSRSLRRNISEKGQESI